MEYFDFKATIEEILSIEPTLTAEGVNSRRTFSEDPIKEEEFRHALVWVDDQKRTKNINRKLTSYHMKHYVEKFVEERYGRHKYISSGAAIAAIIYLGIPYNKFKDSREICAAIKILKKEKNKSGVSTDYLHAFIEELRRQDPGTAQTSAAEA